MTITNLPESTLACCGLLLLAACAPKPDPQSVQQGVCSIAVDGDFNEEADGIPDRITTNIFTEGGRLLRQDVDSNGDGGKDEHTLHLYDDRGQNHRSERYHTATETLLSTAEQVFDEQGRVVLATRDHNADGIIDTTTLTIFESTGRSLRVTEDWNFDGDADRIVETRYGPFGVTETTTSSPRQASNFEQRIVYSYSDRGLLLRSEDFTDGTLIASTEHTYTESGQTSTSLSTRDGAQSLTIFSHDERGFIDGWVRDDDLDGTIDGSAVCAFDDEGRMLSEDVDSDNDGIVDYAFSSLFDEHGRMLEEVTDQDGETGEARRVVSYQYDCD